MASKVKGQKQEPSEMKMEARSALNKALEAAEAENEREQAAEHFDDDTEESIQNDETEESVKKSDKKIKAEQVVDNQDELHDDDFENTAKQSKFSSSKIQQPKPIQQASYIMKLFDRSVNLAKFDEDTPLYPLCRAWMKNQPRALNVKNEKESDSNVVQTVEDGDVVEIPKVRIRNKNKPLVSRPDNKINKKDFDKKIDSEIWTKEKLFEYHRARWQEERARHIENSRIFEEKHFAANFELLESLMRDNEDE